MTRYIWQNKNWTDFRWDNQGLIRLSGECRLKQGKLLGRVASLGFDLGNKAQVEILSEEVTKSAAIEGERLDTNSVRSSVMRALGFPAEGRFDRNVDGFVSMLLDATQNHTKALTKSRLFSWHASLFPTGYSGMRKTTTGKWRFGPDPMEVVSGPARRERVHYEAPPSVQVPVEMDKFLNWWNKKFRDGDGLIRSALAHFWFVTIHPFEDGNGRIARALTDMALARDDGQEFRYYSLSAQIMAERNKYYSVLESCQKERGDLTEWLVWFLSCFCRAIDRSEDLLRTVLDKAAFWIHYSDQPLLDRQRKVINKMLDAGRGGFEGGLTNRKYQSMANVSRATAIRELKQLVDMGLLKFAPGETRGRNVSYNINW